MTGDRLLWAAPTLGRTRLPVLSHNACSRLKTGTMSGTLPYLF